MVVVLVLLSLASPALLVVEQQENVEDPNAITKPHHGYLFNLDRLSVVRGGQDCESISCYGVVYGTGTLVPLAKLPGILVYP